jgi:hypothetical protein
MNPARKEQSFDFPRVSPRVHSLGNISLNYEGQTEQIEVRPPDVSRNGMFISTALRFPEGAVLNLRFRLALSNVEIRTRCEVRYCLPGVGVGVEFLGISADAVDKIENEVKLCGGGQKRRPRKTAARPQKK